MQNDKEFLSDLFKTLGQSMSDGIELNDSIKPQSRCDHEWAVIGWSTLNQSDILECRKCQEVRIEEGPGWSTQS